jgi:hypothetical protein
MWRGGESNPLLGSVSHLDMLSQAYVIRFPRLPIKVEYSTNIKERYISPLSYSAIYERG